MVCPHCHETIPEQDRYLMSRDPDAEPPRWGKWAGFLLFFVILVAAFSLAAKARAAEPVYPPLNSTYTYGRLDPTADPFQPYEILSLVSENHQTNSFAWPLYVQVRATDAPGATINTSQSTGVNVRAISDGPGSPWLAAVHSEVRTGPVSGGASLAFNGELYRQGAGGTVYGLELNSQGLPPDAGINLDGHYKRGIDLHGNSIAGVSTINGQPYPPPATADPDPAPSPRYVGRATLAPGVWVGYVRGRICLHRPGRVRCF